SVQLPVAGTYRMIRLLRISVNSGSSPVQAGPSLKVNGPATRSKVQDIVVVLHQLSWSVVRIQKMPPPRLKPSAGRPAESYSKMTDCETLLSALLGSFSCPC